MRVQQKTVLQKTALLVRAGMMEPPKWYRAAKQVPPFHRRPSNGVETLQLPWDTLAREFAERNPHMVEDSEWLGPKGFQPGAPPISHVFAKRQHALMQNGVRKEEAYKRTQTSMKQERAEDVAKVQRMVREASSMTGSKPSFVSSDDVHSGLRYWQSMMQETPYPEWDLPAKQGLDVFLRREVIGWDDDQFKFAQSAKDGTAGAIEAEVNRLRVTLFPETKTDDYAFPSNVVRRADDDEAEDINAGNDDDGGDDDDVMSDGGTFDGGISEGEEKEVGGEMVDWKSALPHGSWTETLQRFEEMTEEVPHELDWSKQDSARLDNFIMGRCVRRSVLEEAFGWVSDPVAVALAKMDAAAAAAASAASASAVAKDGTDGVAPASAVDGASPEGGAVEETGNGQVDDGERWVTGKKLDGFHGDWMALAHWRLGKSHHAEFDDAGVGGRGAKVARGKGGRRLGKDVAKVSRPLEANLKAVLVQAKRQLLPDLVLAVDDKTPEASAEQRRARIEAKKKVMMADIEWEKEEVEAERDEIINRLRAGMGVEKSGPLSELRAKDVERGLRKPERRRLLQLEKELYEQQQLAMDAEEEEEPSVDDGRSGISGEVFESEIIRARVNELFAKEKARIKRNAKLKADAAVAGKNRSNLKK